MFIFLSFSRARHSDYVNKLCSYYTDKTRFACNKWTDIAFSAASFLFKELWLPSKSKYVTYMSIIFVEKKKNSEMT